MSGVLVHPTACFDWRCDRCTNFTDLTGVSNDSRLDYRKSLITTIAQRIRTA